uniref:Uncharacterized protein n=1 Tax=Candidatus Methanogaster sp. ANME-2c ERB4 TaxID=2759911 RepID=A0A7G9YDH1_9EURY|nr:hypothetical protein FINKGBGL_00005 [Methanosarcinales archaeon ANME-2c ERB4]
MEKGRRVAATGMAGGYGARRGCADATDEEAGAALGARGGGTCGEGLSGMRAQYNSV